jgi:hypothetical protein
MLRLSENGRGAESRKSGQTWPFGTNHDFGKISPWPPQNLCIRKTLLTNTALCWLLIRPILTLGLVATGFWSQVTVLNWFQTERIGEWISQIYGPKMSKTRWGLITDSVAHLVSFFMPTHTHDFDNQSDGYGRLKTADVQSSTDCRKIASSTVWNPEMV